MDFLGFGQLTLVQDFRALYAYKCGQYKHCLQMSMHSVSALAVNRVDIDTYLCLPLIPECIQLLDDDIVSLIGLVLIVGLNPSSILLRPLFAIHQLVLSLYLTTQCQIKLHHSLMSLAMTLDYIQLARSNIGRISKYVLDSFHGNPILNEICIADQHVLKFVEQMILRYIAVSYKR